MNSKTLFYIIKRIALAILTVWIVITITFFVSRAVPGGPFASEKAITPAAKAALEAKYGLDKPLLEQYGTYLKDIVTEFDFGPSLKNRGRDVIDVIADGMKTSAKLGIAAGDRVKVISRRGSVEVEARITDIVAEGVLFMPFHFADGPANLLTNTVIDPTAKIPELKVCAARIEKVSSK